MGERYGVIYGLSLDDGIIRYVGKTVGTAENRLGAHIYLATYRDSQYPSARWIRKHGGENIRTRVLCHALLDDLYDAEQWWIADLREQGYNLLNLTDGGPGLLGFRHTEESRKRMSDAATGKTWSAERREAAKGRVFSEEHRANIRAALVGRPRTEADRAGRVAAAEKLRGYKHTDETRKKVSNAMTGTKKNLTDEQRAARAESNRRAHTGRKRSEETKQKIREARLASGETPARAAARKAVSEKNRGRKHSEEAKTRISESNKGRKISDAHREAISKAKQTTSDETREKQRAAALARHERERAEGGRPYVITEARRAAIERARGRKMSDESREKMRAAKLRVPEEELRARMTKVSHARQAYKESKERSVDDGS